MNVKRPVTESQFKTITITASESGHETELSYCEILLYINQDQIIAQILPVNIKYLYSVNTAIFVSL